MSSSSNFALIPARGGSKGVHKKNLQIIDGIPLVARAILSCKNSKSIDEIVVSSDDSEILQIAKEFGAIPLLRPDNLSTDIASTDPVINHAIDYVINNIKPPIFFKKREFIIFQCKVWNLKLINIILNRLIELELKCKLNHFSER